MTYPESNRYNSRKERKQYQDLSNEYQQQYFGDITESEKRLMKLNIPTDASEQIEVLRKKLNLTPEVIALANQQSIVEVQRLNFDLIALSSDCANAQHVQENLRRTSKIEANIDLLQELNETQYRRPQYDDVVILSFKKQKLKLFFVWCIAHWQTIALISLVLYLAFPHLPFFASKTSSNKVENQKTLVKPLKDN